MQVYLSDNAGACYGVKRALKLVSDAAAALGASTNSTSLSASPSSNPATPSQVVTPGLTRGLAPRAQQMAEMRHSGPQDEPAPALYTLGPLIHNPQVVAELEAKGAHVANSVSEVPRGTLVLRSHGVAPQVVEEARAKGLTIVDATCPHVSKAQTAARELREAGYTVVVVGEQGHPEVEGISAYAGPGAIVAQTPAELPPQLPARPVGIVVQTTQSREALAAIVAALRARGIEPEVRDTVCSATRLRQEAAQRLAHQVDVMLVVGGRNSGNTTRLAQICAATGTPTHHIETPAELDPTWFQSADKVGVTAGASTPESQINSVVQALEALG